MRLYPEGWGPAQASKAQAWGCYIHLSDAQKEVGGDSYPGVVPQWGWGRCSGSEGEPTASGGPSNSRQEP